MRTTRTAVGLALTSLLLAGCGGGGGTPSQHHASPSPNTSPSPAGTSPSPGQGAGSAAVTGQFAPYASGAPAVTYDEAVPEGANVAVDVHAAGDRTEFVLRVRGLQPDRAYGAHLHTKPCGPNPDDSGPHYQNDPDSHQPSTDPKYANDKNEAWLDFTTDSQGAAKSETTVDWVPRSGEARSIVIHAEHTHTDPGHAGQAGDRLACVNVLL
ncbi:superoxide dismutase family protein [Marinitenerispora sediminis]|uniref:Superoxide dismutase n=1 Tax=Marinitenerispora sediminis TaxID=1931232 RepID=A0A368T1A3_9ACTN|nr:superoxide dismutase family protein [Marinitenerispora sediminis]RCV52785.1 superoxide dismutase [Marinitenerispora sediminis]RCV53742.1 superoxide dismutase [Marinitenerispora sediminis]RCV54079.1 superoxide dismutase [Marinitenerispora sediminis]